MAESVDKECMCGALFRTGEDYRDHFPCDEAIKCQNGVQRLERLREVTRVAVAFMDGKATMENLQSSVARAVACGDLVD